MPKIAPFCAVKPASALAKKVVVNVENLTVEEAKSIGKENASSFVHLLVPQIEHRYLQGSKKEIAFKKISENYDEFLENKTLIKDEKPAIYIYAVSNINLTQTGIWTITAIDDYLNNTVKKHEHTRADREKVLIEYLQQTEIDANPVLITHYPDEHLNEIIKTYTLRNPDLCFVYENAEHRLWCVYDGIDIDKITKIFANNDLCYIADGHHRAAAAATLGIEKRKQNLKHKGNEPYNFFSSVYMDTEQVKIYEFHRLVKDLNGLTENQLLEVVSANFKVTEVDKVNVLPKKVHEFGMYLHYKCYRLSFLKTYNSNNPVDLLDVSILQNQLLDPVLGIADPRINSRITFIPARSKSLDEIIKMVDEEDLAVAFFLYPTTINQLIEVANEGEVMPPKSTWFEPKFPVGLVTHNLSY